jgi:hypothetical protein
MTLIMAIIQQCTRSDANISGNWYYLYLYIYYLATNLYSLNRTNVLYYSHESLVEVNMSLLKFAIEKQHWNLAAHTIVLATVKVLNQEVKSDGGKNKTQKRRAKG